MTFFFILKDSVELTDEHPPGAGAELDEDSDDDVSITHSHNMVELFFFYVICLFFRLKSKIVIIQPDDCIPEDPQCSDVIKIRPSRSESVVLCT